MSRFKRLAFILVIGLTASSVSLPAAAGTIEVMVHHRDGWPIVGQEMHLTPLSAYREAARTGRMLRPIYEIEKTDEEGRAFFEGVPAGTYTVSVFGHPNDPQLVKPADNPLAPAPIVTLRDPDDSGRIAVELWPGVPLSLEIAGLDDLPLDGFWAAFRDPEMVVEVDVVGFRQPLLEHRLAPAVWEVSIKPRPGFELVGLERDGKPLEAATARLDLARERWETHLRFSFATSPILPEGVVTVEDSSSGDAPLQIGVKTAGNRYGLSVVEIYALADLSEPVRSATAFSGRRTAAISDLPPGDYLVVAGSRYHLEARAEVRDFDGEVEPRTVELVLQPGAAIRLQALDGLERPVVDLEVEIERLGGEPEIQLRDESVRDAKRRRAGSVGGRGWFEATGFYPGRYLLRTRLRRASAADFEIYLGPAGGELTGVAELEVELDDEPVEIEARVLSASDRSP